MKTKTVLFFLMFGFLHANAQYANVEFSSGGFSFVPAFTDTNPNIILTAGTSNKSFLSAHMIGNIRMGSLDPRGFIFITRAKLVDKPFKLSAGIHLPAIQIDTSYQVDTFFAQELIASYRLSKRWNLSAMYIHGKGRNNDLEIHLLTLNAQLKTGRFSLSQQFYALDLDQTFGLAENISYALGSKWFIKAFANYTLTNDRFIWTLGLQRRL